MMTHKIKPALLICYLIIALWRPFVSAEQQPPKPTTADQSPALAPKNYERFTHQTHQGMVKVPNTNFARELKCDTCHERPGPREIANGIVATTERNKQLSLKFPGHKACVECHVVEFTSRPPQTCTICHNTEQGLTARPPQRDFPPRYDFNAFFDAKQHELHVTYLLPNNGQRLDCAFCHQPTAKPSFLTIASHPECYACHSPQSGDQKGSQKSGCVVCHTEPAPNLQPFSAKYVSRAYGANFTHKAHVGYVNGRCDACHTISGGYNQPAPTSLRIKQHLSPGERSGRGCFSCHDGGVHYGRKVFSGEPGTEGGGSCNKCHTRDDFKVIPTSG
jgi:hypothetical protein